MSDRDVDPARIQLVHARVATAARVTVRAVLQDGVVKGIGDHIELGPLQNPHQFKRIIIIVVVHRRRMARRCPMPPLPFYGELRHHFDKAGLIIPRLIAMHID